MLQLIAQLQAEPLYLMSLAKPIITLAVLGPWAWIVGRLDKDAGYYYLKQQLWSMAHIGAGLVGFAFIVLFPIFWVGLVLGLMVLAGESAGYVLYRNREVDEAERWSGMDIIRKVQREREQKAAERAIERSGVKLMDKNESRIEIPHGSDPRTPAFDYFQDMLSFGVPRGAELLEINVDAEKAAFSAKIDGVRYPLEAPENALCVQLIDFIKEHAGMDVNDRRRKQTGKIWVEIEGMGKHTLQVTVAGSTRALQMQIEIDPQARTNIAVEKLGLLPKQLTIVKQLVQETSGVVLIASPPGTGTTTTIYSLMQAHDAYTASVLTFEKEAVFSLEGVSHNLFPAGASNDQIQEQFASLLRSDPNVMMVSQLVSTDMAKMAAQQAEDTRFYIPMPAKDTLAALKIWLKVVGDRPLAAQSLSAIISQRLVRKLCPTCRAPYLPDAAAMKRLKITNPEQQLFKASGKLVIKNTELPCTLCHGLGYRGRVAVFEVMHIDREARSLIASGEGERLRSHLRKNHMLYLQEAALANVVEGITDIKEVTRVLGEQKD